MKTLITIFIFLSLSSCSLTRKLAFDEVVGEYKWDETDFFVSIIELKSDSTFEYNWNGDLSSGTTKGTWDLRGRKVILNSEHQPNQSDKKKYEVLKLDSTYSDSITVEVFFTYIYRDISDEPAPFVQCLLKSDNEVLFENETDLDGVVKLPRIGADSLIIDFLGRSIVRHGMDSSITHYVFKIFDDPETWNYQFFTDEVWRFREGRLYDPSIKKDKYVKKDYYEKIK